MMRQINSEQKLITARISQRVVLFSLAADCAMEVTPQGVISLVLVALISAACIAIASPCSIGLSLNERAVASSHQLLYDISIKNISCRPKSKWRIWGHVLSQNLSKKYVHSRCAPFCCTLHT